jgi:hypothetical protein
MTVREGKLLILAGIVIVGGLAFNYWSRADKSAGENSDNGSRLLEADRLLRLQANITARHKASTAELKALQGRFFSAAGAETAKLSLLKTVEAVAIQSNLAVHRKSMVSFRDDTIGVALEGKTSPESLIRFLHLTVQNQTGLRVHRLQIHSLPDAKQLNYQVTIISMLIK